MSFVSHNVNFLGINASLLVDISFFIEYKKVIMYYHVEKNVVYTHMYDRGAVVVEHQAMNVGVYQLIFSNFVLIVIATDLKIEAKRFEKILLSSIESARFEIIPSICKCKSEILGSLLRAHHSLIVLGGNAKI